MAGATLSAAELAAFLSHDRETGQVNGTSAGYRLLQQEARNNAMAIQEQIAIDKAANPNYFSGIDETRMREFQQMANVLSMYVDMAEKAGR